MRINGAIKIFFYFLLICVMVSIFSIWRLTTAESYRYMISMVYENNEVAEYVGQVEETLLFGGRGEEKYGVFGTVTMECREFNLYIIGDRDSKFLKIVMNRGGGDLDKWKIKVLQWNESIKCDSLYKK